MPRPRPRTRGTGNLRTPAVVLGFCDSRRHHLQLKSVLGRCSTSLLWIRIKSGPPLYFRRSLPKHRNLGLDEAVTEALGGDRQNYSNSLASILASSAKLRQNDLVIGNEVGCRYVFAAFPVYEILTVANLARRLLSFLMQ